MCAWSSYDIRILVTFVKRTGSAYHTKLYRVHQFIWDTKAVRFWNFGRMRANSWMLTNMGSESAIPNIFCEVHAPCTR